MAFMTRREGASRRAEQALFLGNGHGHPLLETAMSRSIPVAAIAPNNGDPGELPLNSQSGSLSRAVHRGLLRRIVNAHEEERVRLSRELHDQVGQDLVAISLLGKSLIDLSARRERGEAAKELLRIVETLSINVRRVAEGLRPTSLEQFGLERALAELTESFSARLGFDIDYHARDLEIVENEEAALAIYRIVQEALANAARHSGATAISVTVQRLASDLLVAIEDNGCGFDLSAVKLANGNRFGLTGMRERVSILDGTIAIETEHQAGTAVFARIPLESMRTRRNGHERGSEQEAARLSRR